MPLLLSVTEAMDLIRVGDRRNFAKLGIPYVKRGKRKWYDPRDIYDYIDRNKEKCRSIRGRNHRSGNTPLHTMDRGLEVALELLTENSQSNMLQASEHSYTKNPG